MTIPPNTGRVPAILGVMPRILRSGISPQAGGSPPPTIGQLWPRKAG